MKIDSVRIENFRAFADVTVPLNQYACLVGPNGAGKSTILNALNVFFRESDQAHGDLSQLDAEDFHQKQTDSPIKITVTFTDLGEESRNDLSDYVRQGQLVVSAIANYDDNTGKATVEQYGQRLGMGSFAPFFRALKTEKVARLKEIYSELRRNYAELPTAGTRDAMINSLRQYEAEHPDSCELLLSEDQFYGFKGTSLLTKYVQWVYVPAVKDPTTEQTEARNSALGKLLTRTVRSKTSFDQRVKELRDDMKAQYERLLEENQDSLNDVSDSLQTRLSEWAHPDVTLRLRWKQDPDKSVRVEEPSAHIVAGEGEFQGELFRFGHGLQRSYLLALLQELSATGNTEEPDLILACEEPELYQHPPQSRHLAAVLQELTGGSSQAIVSTHEPLFVSGDGFEDVRMVQKESGSSGSSVSHMSFGEISEAVGAATGEKPSKPEGVLAKVHQSLQPHINEMFFARRLVLVEGLEDIAYLLTYLNLMERTADFRRVGGHVVQTNGKSQLLKPLVIAKHMGISTYLVFDSDADKPDRNGSRSRHEKDNRALLSLVGDLTHDPMPDKTVHGMGFTMWHSDIGETVKAEIGHDQWERASREADKCYGHAGQLKKNSLHIGATLGFAWQDGNCSDSLMKLCNAVIDLHDDVGLTATEQ